MNHYETKISFLKMKIDWNIWSWEIIYYIEVIEWNFPNIDNSKSRTSKTEVLNQELLGFNSINQSLGTSCTLSKIYYVPWEDGSSLVYQTLIGSLIKHYYEGKEFKEV